MSSHLHDCWKCGEPFPCAAPMVLVPQGDGDPVCLITYEEGDPLCEDCEQSRMEQVYEERGGVSLAELTELAYAEKRRLH